MLNKNKRIMDKILARSKTYITIIVVLLVVLSIQNSKLIIPSIFIFIGIVIYTYYTNSKKRDEISETIQDLSLSLDTVAKTSLINSPFPLLVLSVDGSTIWKNKKFSSEFANIDIMTYVDELIIETQEELEADISKIKNIKEYVKSQEIVKNIFIEDKTYKVVVKLVEYKDKSKNNKKSYMYILNFIDETENQKLSEEYRDSKSCICLIMIDNYEQNVTIFDSDEKPQTIAEIDKCIIDWADETNGVLIKSDKDKYVYLFEQRYLEDIKEDKFSILDKIKDIQIDENYKFTLSIAVSNEGSTDKEKYKSAQSAMDIVLGRGGDQAVIRENDIYKFYGGKTEEVEKRTKVKARIMAHALENLIRESKKVMIIGHKKPDIDAIGSAMGVYRLVKSLGKNAYIVNEETTESIEAFKKEAEEDEEYEDTFIGKEVALENLDAETLLVVVDTHKTNFVEVPELLDEADNIVVIDHHRKGTDYIEKATLTFQEVYASSAAELVTELLQHAETEVELKTLEAESLYAGIMMDTKNFIFKTGVRTFEAAAYLRKCGVDIIKVKKWFQSDFEGFNKIADIVRSSEIINDTIAIAIYDKNEENSNLICAKAADELLTISTITASFVLGISNDKIFISGRSIGDINVQMIMEKLGGGGHITLAGAQLKDTTLEDAKLLLIEKINEYFKEQE